MLEAIALWRQYPGQIEAGLTVYCRRSIGEWHRGEMSSRELLGLLDELPESSKFKEARDRTYRLVEVDDKLQLFHVPGELPDGAVVVAQYVDWTLDRKMFGRAVQELAAMRADGTEHGADFNGLREPLSQILINREARKRDEERRGARGAIRAGLFAYERR